jgi:hypothetical protein
MNSKRKYDLRFWRNGVTSRWQAIQGDASRVAHRDIATGPLLSSHKDDHQHLALPDWKERSAIPGGTVLHGQKAVVTGQL